MNAPLPNGDDDDVVDPLFTKPSAAVVSVDPPTARRWLGRNLKNRHLRPADVNKYARDMERGRWQLTGEPVKFAPDGTLLDGQHRLHAVIKSNTVVLMFVARGIDPDAQRVMDTGTKRTASDALALLGKKNTSLLASTVRNCIAAETVGYAGMGKHQVTHSEVQDFVAEHPDVVAAVDLGRAVARNLDCPPAIVAYAAWRLMAVDADEAARFFTDAASGVGLVLGDPVLAMTKRFAEGRRNRERLSHAAYLSVIFRCWNYRRTGKPLRLVKVNSMAGGLIPVPEPR